MKPKQYDFSARFLTVFAAVSLTIIAALGLEHRAQALEFHGYMRSGTGFSQGGADQVCFSPAGAEGGKFRLGNECETYVELSLSETFRKESSTDTDTHYRTSVRWSLVSAGHRDWEASSTYQSPGDQKNGTFSQDFTLALREAYGEALNVFATGTSVWVGKRFYRRHDLHMLDFYYLANSGPGFGVENIDLGFAQLHLATIRNIPAGDGGTAQTNTDFRLTGLSTPGGGSLTPVVIYGAAGERDFKSGQKTWESLNGAQLALIHDQTLNGAANTFAVQYGNGIFGGYAQSRNSTLSDFGGGNQSIAKGAKTSLEARKKSSTLRVVDQLVFPPSPSFSAGFTLLYQSVDFGGAQVQDIEASLAGDTTPVADKAEASIGIRPVYHIRDNLGVAFEYGYTEVRNAFGVIENGKMRYKDTALHKYTLAPQISQSRDFWGRPQLRLFATYANWNKESKGKVTSSSVYGNDTAGWSTGAQIEAWW